MGLGILADVPPQAVEAGLLLLLLLQLQGLYLRLQLLKLVLKVFTLLHVLQPGSRRERGGEGASWFQVSECERERERWKGGMRERVKE